MTPEIRVWLWFCGVVFSNLSSSAIITLRERELIDLHIEFLLLSLLAATSIVCESFLFDSGFMMFSSSATAEGERVD